LISDEIDVILNYELGILNKYYPRTGDD